MALGEETTIVVTRIEGLQQLKNTRDGNPRFRAFSAHGNWLTEPDAQVAFGIRYWLNKQVRLVLNAKGNIIEAQAELST